ncbi:MAG: hypothetical protein M3R51_08185 [Candidatus Eremiobacteraeota bacterium]|nr:hypothetical protein [Candidatus Eremiobacteraeota bacterium]
MMEQPAWDGILGTAGGPAFGTALAAFAAERDIANDRLAAACELPLEIITGVLEGRERVGISAIARIAQALRSRPVEFFQKTGIFSLGAYAFGLDPLYFLPEGPLRYTARIYMREINPRHQVPEGDMTKRNVTIKTVADDELLDSLGKLEVEMAYLLRVAVQHTGGTL